CLAFVDDFSRRSGVLAFAGNRCADVIDDDLRALCGHGQCEIPTNAAAGSRDNHDFVFEHETDNTVKLRFFYGWVIVGLAFVTMAISVTSRTAFSLLLPPLIDEFGWNRGLAAGAFSFGFFVSALLAPIVGRAMDRRCLRLVIGSGVGLVSAGLFLAPAIKEPWPLYATLGLLVGAGANFMSFTAQSLFLPHWFVRRRGLAISIAFSGVGVGAIVLLPWLQQIIGEQGWRASCWTMGLLVLLVLGPLNLLVRHKPADLCLVPDGEAAHDAAAAPRDRSNVVDRDWVAIEWTLARALRTARFWWIALGYFCALFAW